MKNVKAEIAVYNNIIFYIDFHIKLSPTIYLHIMKNKENIVSKNERKNSQDHKLF